MTPILGIIGSSVPSLASYESIQTATVSNTSSVTFSNIPQTYKHLEIRGRGQVTYSSSADWWRGRVQINGTTAAYVELAENAARSTVTWQSSTGDGSGGGGYFPASGPGQTNMRSGVILEFPDYTNTAIAKHCRTLGGANYLGSVNAYDGFGSVGWTVTDAITSITVLVSGTNFATASFALYGIKG